MKFAISSHKNYFFKTKDKILLSLLNCGINANDIYFFVGGMDRYQNVSCCPNILYVPHNSLDFTALISIIELDLKFSWWFLLHDTCFVGPNFYKKILEFNYNNCKCVRLSGLYSSMNIGAYSWVLLQEKKDELLKLKNISKDIDKFKKYLIEIEDIFFNNEKFIYYETCERNISDPIDFYKTGTLRKIFHYPELDLYKIQANWTLKENGDYLTIL